MRDDFFSSSNNSLAGQREENFCREGMLPRKMHESDGSPKTPAGRDEAGPDGCVTGPGGGDDISEGKEAEEELRLSRQRLSLHVENTPLAVIEFDIDGRIRGWNPAAEKIFGFSRGEAVGRHWTFIVPAVIHDRLDAVWADLIARRGGSRSTNENITKGGKTISCEWFSTPLIDQDGNTIGVASLVMDVTDRLEAEAALKARERQLAESQRIAHIGSWEHNLATGRISWSDELFRLLGLDPSTDEANIETFLETISPEDRPVFQKATDDAVRSRSGYKIDLRIPRKDGTTRVLRIQAEVLADGGGPIVLRGTAQDITERRQAEAALELASAYNRNLIEVSLDPLFTIGEYGRITDVNAATEGVTGLTRAELIGTDFSSYFTEPARARDGYEQVFRTGSLRDYPLDIEHRDGHITSVLYNASIYKDDAGKVIGVVAAAHDITERKHLEEQLRHSQKIESLGTLAGGVAHDFNNILNVIVGYGGMMEMRLQKDDPNIAYLREILAAAKRATKLTQALLIFSRKQGAAMKPVNINSLIENMRKMMLRLIREDIETTISLSPETLTVMGDYGQLEQVLMNLITNARDAMPDGGHIGIETRPYTLDREFIHMHGYGKQGRYALISISDTGAGMDEKTRERIFEPFFTTKQVGKGTGLGLALVYGIVKQHNGFINCYSEPGIGTTFRVYLPLTKEEPVEPEEAEECEITGGRETVLVADDDESIRNLTRELLEKFGYSVIEAIDGEDAVIKFRDHEKTIDLVLMDVIMPRKSGREAFEEIRAMKDNVKILFISGYTEDIIQRKRIVEDELPLLQKPIRPRDLLSHIRRIIDGK